MEQQKEGEGERVDHARERGGSEALRHVNRKTPPWESEDREGGEISGRLSTFPTTRESRCECKKTGKERSILTILIYTSKVTIGR